MARDRISPRHSPVPSCSVQQSQPAPPTPAPASKPEPEMELDLSTTLPSVEDTLAARRARRQAILAKYTGLASINTSQTASPSPGPSSAAELATAISAVSDPPSQLQSVPVTPGASVTPSILEPAEGLGRCFVGVYMCALTVMYG
jgi:serine/threonine-protein kinase PRP4